MVLNHHSTRLCARVGGTVVKQMPGCPWPGDPVAPVRERERRMRVREGQESCGRGAQKGRRGQGMGTSGPGRSMDCTLPVCRGKPLKAVKLVHYAMRFFSEKTSLVLRAVGVGTALEACGYPRRAARGQ